MCFQLISLLIEMISFKADIKQEIQIPNDQSQPNEKLESTEKQFDNLQETKETKNETSDILNEAPTHGDNHEAHSIDNYETEMEKEDQIFDR